MKTNPPPASPSPAAPNFKTLLKSEWLAMPLVRSASSSNGNVRQDSDGALWMWVSSGKRVTVQKVAMNDFIETPETCPDCGHPFFAGYHMPGEACPAYLKKTAPAAPCPSASHLPLVPPVGVTGADFSALPSIFDKAELAKMKSDAAPVSPSLPAHTPFPWQLSVCKLSGDVWIEYRDALHKEAVAKMGPTLSGHEMGNAELILSAVRERESLKADVERLTGALKRIAAIGITRHSAEAKAEHMER